MSATRASGASAGWQQVKISRRRSSGDLALALVGEHRLVLGRALARSARAARARRSFPRQRALAPQAVDRLVARDAGDPGARVVGHALPRPALERDDERLLDRVLGDVEVTEDADQGRDRPPRLVPEQAVDDRSLAPLRGRASAAAGSS